MAYLVFDIAILAILVLFAWRGASRGFVLSLCGLLAVIVAFVGASFLANLLAPRSWRSSSSSPTRRETPPPVWQKGRATPCRTCCPCSVTWDCMRSW